MASSSSRAPTPEHKTLLSLPPEILISCLLLPSRQYGYDLKPPLPPKSVLLVSRYMYRIAAPYLYAHLWVEPYETALGQSPLLPFLTARQRSALALPSWPRMADPAWVHELTILPGGPPEHGGHDSELCRVLSLVLPTMKLRSIHWEGRQNDESVARVVAQQKELEKICCRVGGPLWHSGLKGLKEIVSWHDEMFPYDQEDTNTRTGLLQESADTVQTLHLAVGYVFDGIADMARRILKGVETMPKVRVLRLTGFNKEAVAAIERVIAFGSVEEFQIMRGVGLDVLRGKDLSSAHSLSGNATTRGLFEILNGCETLRLRDLRVKFVDYHWPWEGPSADHQPPPPSNIAIIEALGRHGAALNTLILGHNIWDTQPTKVVALREKEVKRLVESCPCLEELSITVELGEFIIISPFLAKLPRLSHLALNIVHDSPAADHHSSSPPYHLPPSTMPPWPVDKHWLYPGNSGWDPVRPTAVTPLEVVISHLLAAGPPRIQSVYLDITNTNPESPLHHNLRNRYEMRPGTPEDRRPRGPGDFLHAPPGQRYAWSGGEFVVVSWDRFRVRESQKSFVSASWWTSSFEGQQMTV
ncbi:hypothetical protein P167DRAFT_579729 [Morchella conica CCBAS932]|uniref:Uncharacterized protein n=1 Tax=Morchella conica CCBAS932 TaxID=1392247 RepID=A0A3N4KC23_9PEZI|nr:hypothetical protein P167DRAFT_579729 [Morchella conica CCBAS932]